MLDIASYRDNVGDTDHADDAAPSFWVDTLQRFAKVTNVEEFAAENNYREYLKYVDFQWDLLQLSM